MMDTVVLLWVPERKAYFEKEAFCGKKRNCLDEVA